MEGDVRELVRSAMNGAFSPDNTTKEQSLEQIMHMRSSNFPLLLAVAVEMEQNFAGDEQFRAACLTNMCLNHALSEEFEEPVIQMLDPVIQTHDAFALSCISNTVLSADTRMMFVTALATSLKVRYILANYDAGIEQLLGMFDQAEDETHVWWLGNIISAFLQKITCDTGVILRVAFSRLQRATRGDVAKLILSILDQCVKILGECHIDGLEWRGQLMNAAMMFMGTPETAVTAMNFARRLIKYTEGSITVEPPNNIEAIITAMLGLVSATDDPEILISFCDLNSVMIKNTFAEVEIPICYNPIIAKLYEKLLHVEDGCTDPSEWSVDQAARRTIMLWSRATHYFDMDFCQRIHALKASRNFNERFLSAVMMTSAVVTSNGIQFLVSFLDDMLMLTHDGSPKVREQALLALISGIGTHIPEHSSNPDFGIIVERTFEMTCHLRQDFLENQLLLIKLYRVLVKVPGFTHCADVFASIWQMTPGLSEYISEDTIQKICRMITTTHISYLPSVAHLLDVISGCCSAGIIQALEITMRFLDAILARFSETMFAPFAQQTMTLLNEILECGVFEASKLAILPFSRFVVSFPSLLPQLRDASLGLVNRLMNFVGEHPDTYETDMFLIAIEHFQEAGVIPDENQLEFCCRTISFILEKHDELSKSSLYSAISLVATILANPVIREAPDSLCEPLLAISPIILSLAQKVLRLEAPEEHILFDIVISFLYRLIGILPPPAYLELYAEIIDELIIAIIDVDMPSRPETLGLIMFLRMFKTYNPEKFHEIRLREDESLTAMLQTIDDIGVQALLLDVLS